MGLFSKKHSIGKTIAELRKEKGWTQIELAEKLQVSDKAVSKWEKDSGAPSVEFFPALAELFGVSIDYIMTGKKVEPEIIAMSKAELCAKNDDVSMVNDINLTTKDENGKTLIDYIVQYKSYKVFAAICDEKSFISLQGANSNSVKKFDILTLLEFALITNKISVLDRGFVLNTLDSYSGQAQFDFKSLTHIEEKKSLSQGKQLCVLTDKIFDIIVQDKRVDINTILYLLSKQNKHECVWYLGLPYLLHQSYLHNNIELFNMVLNVAIANNQGAYEKWPIVVDSWYGPNYDLGYFAVFNKGDSNYYFGVVRALEKTIKLALERSDIETVEKLNELNNAVMKYHAGFKCYIATADEIRIAKLKMDKSISESEIKIQSTIHEGVVCIDELLNLNDFKIIKKVLNEYPIHIVELLDEWLSKSKWKELYHFAIDNNNESLANAIIAKDDKEYISRAIQEYFKKDKYNFNKKHFYIMTDYSIVNGGFKLGQLVKGRISLAKDEGLYISLSNLKTDLLLERNEMNYKAYKKEDFVSRIGEKIEVCIIGKNPIKISQKTNNGLIRGDKLYKQIIEKPSKAEFLDIRERIIDDLSLRLDKEKTIGDLTKEYFESELGKGNTDMVIIKLCVRLEAVLRCDYHYEGDLSIMIDKYCQEHGWEDDGWGYSVESNHVKYLQKLRMKRNNIVHSEKNSVDLTLEEIKYCIDYICKMG